MPDRKTEETSTRRSQRKRRRRRDPLAGTGKAAETLNWFAEFAHFTLVEREPLTPSRFHEKYKPELSRESAERTFERLKKKLVEHGVPHERVEVPATGGHGTRGKGASAVGIVMRVRPDAVDKYAAPLKRCTRCGEFKPARRPFFYAHSGRRDGLQSQCSACRIKLSKMYHKTHMDQVRARQRTARAKELRRRYRESAGGILAAAKHTAAQKHNRALNYARAHLITALARGVLVRASACSACGVCPPREECRPIDLGRPRLRPGPGARSGIVAFWNRGHEHPLDVTWLCRVCHRAWTDARKRGEAVPPVRASTPTPWAPPA